MLLTTFKCGNCGSYKYSCASYNGKESTHECRDCGTETKNGILHIEVPFPTIVIEGSEVDSSEEFEKFFDSDNNYPFGVNVALEFREESNYTNTTVYNVTEIHYMYKPGGESVALESDIHSTGWTPEVAKLVKMTVVPATKEHTDYYEE